MTAIAVPVPTLETERLRLRGFVEADVDALAAMNGDAETMRYIGTGVVLDRVQTWRGVAGFMGHWHLRGFGIWAVEEKTSGHFVGRVGLWNPDGWPGLEVGWLIGRDRWGRGYATEAGAAAIAFAWDHVDTDRLISLIRPENAASIRVAEKLGEQLVDEIDVDGPALVYGIDRPDGR